MSFLIQRSINQLKVLRQFSRNQDKSNLFHDDFTSKPENKLTGFRQTKFQIFTNEEATEILDIDEERQKTESQTLTELHESIYQNLNLQSNGLRFQLYEYFIHNYYFFRRTSWSI